jgi:hypothetical protein
VCSRVDGPTADSIGVQVSYTYNFSTPLGSLIRLLGGSSAGRLDIVDKTVMALNPTE